MQADSRRSLFPLAVVLGFLCSFLIGAGTSTLGQTAADPPEKILAEYREGLKNIERTFSTFTLIGKETKETLKPGTPEQILSVDIRLERDGMDVERSVEINGTGHEFVAAKNKAYCFVLERDAKTQPFRLLDYSKELAGHDDAIVRLDDIMFNTIDMVVFNGYLLPPMRELRTKSSYEFSVEAITPITRDGKPMLKIGFKTSRLILPLKISSGPGSYFVVSPSEGWALYEVMHIVSGTVGGKMVKDNRFILTVEYDENRRNGVLIPKKIQEQRFEAGIERPRMRKTLEILELKFEKPMEAGFLLPHYGLSVPESKPQAKNSEAAKS